MGSRRTATKVFALTSAVGLAAGCGAGAGTGPTELQRATLLVDRGQEKEAVQVLRRYLRQHPRSLPERRLLIRVLALTGDLGAAEREAERLASQLGADHPVPWLELGHAYELAHRYDAALVHYDRATEVAPDDARGPATAGLRAARWGEAELAEPRLKEAARRDPSDARVWHALGLVRAKLGRLDEAQAAYLAGLKADPGALENRLGLATLAVLRRDPEAALKHYDALLAKRPKFAAGHLGRSWSLLLLGRLDEAEVSLERGAELGAEAAVVERQRALLEHLRKRRQVKPKR